MDPTLQEALMAYFNSNPAFASEYERIRGSGETRTPAEWMYDHIKTSPQDFNRFQASVNGGGQQATYEQAVQYFINNVDDGSTAPYSPEFNDRFNAWMGPILARNGVGSIEELPLNALSGGFSSPAAESVPLEQGLLESALPRLLEDIGADEARALQAQIQSAQAQGDYDLVRQLIARATSGQQLAGEMGMADETAGRRRTALQEALDKMYGAQAPVDAARLGEAEGAVTGVNLGLERTLDQLDAERATQGFVGGSTMDTNAATRATIDARQRGANLVGAAKTANAMDARSIGGFDASQGYSIAEELARQRQDLYNADYGRSLQAALSLPQATNQFIQTQRNIDDQRNAGLNRSLGVLNWWANGSTAPTATYNPIEADNSGNDLAGLGANLTSAALNIGAANNWWRSPSGTYKGIPVTNTYSTATSTPNWWTPNPPI